MKDASKSKPKIVKDSPKDGDRNVLSSTLKVFIIVALLSGIYIIYSNMKVGGKIVCDPNAKHTLTTFGTCKTE